MARFKRLVFVQFSIFINYFVYCIANSASSTTIGNDLRTTTVANLHDCSDRAACNSSTNYELPTGQYLSWSNRNCMCDQKCVIYGDCCPSSPFYNETEQRTNYELYSCSHIPQMNYYMQQSCPPNYSNAIIKSKCEKHSIGQRSDDLKIMKPVTNLRSNITYANEYCALCNSVADFDAWPLKLTCISKPINCFPKNYTDLIRILGNAKFDQNYRIFHSTFNGTNYTCAHEFIKPEKLLPRLRPCRLYVVSQCIDIQDQETVDQCKSFTSLVYSATLHTTYRNEFCAKCCREAQTISNCEESSGGIHGIPASPFSTLFNNGEDIIGSSMDVCRSGNEQIQEKFC